MPANAIVPVNHSKIDLHFLFVKFRFSFLTSFEIAIAAE